MVQRNTPVRSFFPSFRSSLIAGFTVAALAAAPLRNLAQSAPEAAPPAADAAQTAAPAASATLSNQPEGKSRKTKEDKVVQTKDTKKAVKRYKKDNPLEGIDAKLPDKALYDKAMDSIKHGRFDVARLDLQTLLNTYPDSQFQMRAKLAIADSWYKEGGTAALTQAEQEYRDFIVFYPNAPEAAEAQMRIGDIYFKEMDKPDRDHTKAVHAEEEYRLMLQQFPDSPRVPEAAQRLREVQESLASAESDVAEQYGSRQNWAAAIARYQTVADSYPLYSHLDDVLIGLGDAYEAQARFYRGLKLPEAAKAQLVKLYDDQAAAYYRKVVLEHSAAPHVEDARDRLAEMNRPIPTPTPEQAAASIALENSRGQYTLSKRALLLLMHRPDTVEAATIGNPPLEDAPRTLAPTIIKRNVNEFNVALNPGAAAAAAAASKPATAPAATTAEAPAAAAPSPASPQQPAASTPLAFQDVPSANGAPTGPAVNTTAPAAVAPASAGGGGIGAEIVQPSGPPPATPAQPSANPPRFPTNSGAAQPAANPASTSDAPSATNNYGFAPAANTSAQPLAPVEKAPAAPETINEVTPGSQPPAQTAQPGKKNPKPAFDKSDESSSKHKKKKGLDKLNPF